MSTKVHKRLIVGFLLIFAIFSFGVMTFGEITATFAYEGPDEFDKSVEMKEEDQADTYRARVLNVSEQDPPASQQSFTEKIQMLEIEILNGPYEGEVYEIENPISGNEFYDFNVSENDRILIRAETVGEDISNLYIQDFLRETYIYYAVGAFALALLLVGGLKGLKTIFTLSLTLFIIFRFMIPLVAEGYNPLWLSVMLASLVALISLCVIGGLNKKTVIAIIGTVGGVLVAGVLALIVGEAATLTGFSNQEAQLLQYTDIGEIDVQGLLFAGIIIGALGAVMDIGMSIASACYEMKDINPEIEGQDIFKAGLNVGRDIMGTMSNTLVLAYTGTAMPLLLLFLAQDMGYSEIINMDIIATEVVRAIAGSMGLLVAIPITAITSGFLLGNKK
ncbi:YibE/F family protein [Natranaerofaba carboxydovora]|uniref:YibE/F family protein n=1 Tax=Natranaerofaba carboxydovora TaxID=2742683 RepID=UPI001F147679|nr:YibE/F family protein [Natranaerofaba carboxydovora]UMZ75443.1 YibE/F-like protein [Natranaerofaba carboxydovora]